MENWKTWGADDARGCIAIPRKEDDKYSRGVLGVIAGSTEYPGAAMLTTTAALRTGLGLLRYVGPKKVSRMVVERNPEVVLGDGKVSAWVIGSGIASKKITTGHKEQISRAIKSGLPTCLDAGALSFIDKVSSPTLITPHYRELLLILNRKRLVVTLGEISADPKYWARKAADEYGVTVLLKGNVSVVASFESQIELPPATPWLATAGTGDVLAGIIGALLATNAQAILDKELNLASIAATASYIHQGAAKFSIAEGPITSSDVARNISRAIFQIIQ